jgi:hypothetical protein
MKVQVLAPDPFAFRPMTRTALSMARVGTLRLLQIPPWVRAVCWRRP